MKHLILFLIINFFIGCTANRPATPEAKKVGSLVTLKDLEGSYKVTSNFPPQFLLNVVNIITLKEDGTVCLKEIVPNRLPPTLKCQGTVTLENMLLVSNMQCEDRSSYTQKIDLSKVTLSTLSTLSDSFMAPVWTSLYEDLIGDKKIEMNFQRVESTDQCPW